jgi:allantoate deiminase
MIDSTPIRAAAARALERCERLAAFSEDPPRLTRTFLCEAFHGVHREIRAWAEAAGMSTRVDGVGNIVAALQGSDPKAPALLIGSHLDTVSDAGKFDGALGVMLGLAVVELLGSDPLPFGVEVVGFSEEEGVRFATPYIGSKGFVGQMTAAMLDLRDRSGMTVAQALRDFGIEGTPSAFDRSRYVAHIEVHIEQGPVLEQMDKPLGVVSAIVGQSRRRVRFLGQAAHAGTTPMSVRRDALAAAAQWIGSVEQIARATDGGVATVGQISASPGASNVVPGAVEASLDVRHSTDDVRRRMLTQILTSGRDIAAARHLRFEDLGGNDHATVPMDPQLRALLAQSIGADAVEILSGAGHDAAILAPVIPSCMLFLRSPGGVSHHPGERVLPADVEAALAVMLRFVRQLAQRYNPVDANALRKDQAL